MKHHFYGFHLAVHGDFSALAARESEVEARWRGEEAAVGDLPRSTTLCQEATGSRKVAKCV